MQLDHVFLFVENVESAQNLGSSLGLSESYRRTHPGQGTANICYCFENAFLELLFLENAEEAVHPTIARTGLLERSEWRQRGTCPIGLSWRWSDPASPEPFETWPFRPPYLPQGMAIAVATQSDDLFAPMLLRSPGQTPPLEWPHERRGALQAGSGLKRIEGLEVVCPNGFAANVALQTVFQNLSVRIRKGNDWGLTLLCEAEDGRLRSLLVL